MENRIKFKDIGHRTDLLEDAIRSRQLHMLNTTKSGMLELFWKIGKILNDITGTHQDDLLEQLGTRLGKKHSKYLSSSNLKQMKEFATACPEEILRDVSYTAGWGHIPVLSKFAQLSDWVYYSDIVYEKQLTPLELMGEIKEGKPKAKNEMIPFQRFDKALIERYMGNLEFDQFFRSDKRGDFKNLFELKPMENGTGDELIDRTAQMVDSQVDFFRKLYNNVLYHQGYASIEYICEQIALASEALVEETKLQTILNLVSERFNGNISAHWLDGWFKHYKELIQQQTRQPGTLFIPLAKANGESENQVIKKENSTTLVTMIEIKEDLDAGYNIYKNPDIMYFLAQA